jgi:hypothetical protein
MSITVFQILGKITIDDLKAKLEKIKPIVDKRDNPITGESDKLMISIDNIENNKNRIQGTMKYDYPEIFQSRDGKISQIRTKHANFTFMHGSGLFLLVNQNTSDSRIVKQNFARLAFLTQPPSILSCDITPPTMTSFLENNNCEVFSCSWDELDLPRINGTNLKGAGINNTDDFKRYDKHGNKKSVMFNFPEKNITLSINRKAGVHFYTTLLRDQQEDFMKDKILPLCR